MPDGAWVCYEDLKQQSPDKAEVIESDDICSYCKWDETRYCEKHCSTRLEGFEGRKLSPVK